MNMYILILIKISIYFESVCSASDIAQSRLCALLHNIAKRACKLQFARTLKHSDLNFEHFTTDCSPSKSAYNTDLVTLTAQVPLEPLRAKILLNIRGLYSHLFAHSANNLLCGLAAKLANKSLKVTHTALTGVAVNNHPDCIVVYFKLF